MHHPRAARVHPDLCRRIARLHRGADIPVSRLINAILRDALDEIVATRSCRPRTAPDRSWRRR